jgi:hypothetical protein
VSMPNHQDATAIDETPTEPNPRILQCYSHT